jgi:hypothetical protein
MVYLGTSDEYEDMRWDEKLAKLGSSLLNWVDVQASKTRAVAVC